MRRERRPIERLGFWSVMLRRAYEHPARGFTIVELLVVISMIVLLLAMAVPGMNAIQSDSRHSAAVQTVNGVLTRAYYYALADNTLTAVRFMPGEWDQPPTEEGQQTQDRQVAVTYSYVATSSADPDRLEQVKFSEYFERRKGTVSEVMPQDVWVAPVEALDDSPGGRKIGDTTYNPFGAQFALDGELGQFDLDAARTSSRLQNADDFLIVFDPQQGLRRVIEPLRIKAYIPPQNGGFMNGAESDRSNDGTLFYQRYNFTGITLYSREAFMSLGREQGLGNDRQEWLIENSRPYLVHRTGGGLVTGKQE